MKYSTLRKCVQTGDVCLFSGKGRISAGIKWMTHSPWSHVGMIVRIEEWDTVMLWESTTLSNLKDAATGVERQGVQMVPLSERCKSYEGEIAVRPLCMTRTPDMTQALQDLRREVKGRSYEESKIELVRSALGDVLGNQAEDLSSLFCSELVAEAYQRMGLLDPIIPSNSYTPADFASDHLCLLKGSFGKELLRYTP
jgi:hypothetical protein